MTGYSILVRAAKGISEVSDSPTSQKLDNRLRQRDAPLVLNIA
jgi:hypothetical protein